MSTGGDLKSRLRSLTPELIAALRLPNVHDVATKMWSTRNLNDAEQDAVLSCTDSRKAARELLSFTDARGDKGIMSLADALRAIEMLDLAEKLNPATVRCDTTGLSATVGSSTSGAGAVPARTKEELCDNLISASDEIAQGLTKEETSLITRKLYASKCINSEEKEKVEDISRPTDKASALVGILERKDAHVNLRFVDILREINRQRLADMVLFGRTDSS